MKILIIASTLDLYKPFTATPFLIQLFKGFYDESHELLIIPYSGKPIASFWWRAYPNPNYYKSLLLEKILRKGKFSYNKRKLPFIPILARNFATPNLEKLINKILTEQKNVDAVIFIAIPLNHIKGIPSKIKKLYNIPVIFYDLDIPTSLPSHHGETFDYYPGADLGEFDSFIILSEGSVSELKKLGVKDVNVVHIAVDPDICSPMKIEKDIDIFYMGVGGKERENNIRMMITEPSKVLKSNFVVSGRKLEVDLGKAIRVPMVWFSQWRKYCNRAKINLNITRELHANTYGSSTSRPFELGSMGCCIVSHPYKGLEKWFDLKKEILVAHSIKECIEIYKMLLDNPEQRLQMGMAVRNRVIKEHTVRHRVREKIARKYLH